MQGDSLHPGVQHSRMARVIMLWATMETAMTSVMWSQIVSLWLGPNLDSSVSFPLDIMVTDTEVHCKMFFYFYRKSLQWMC